MMCEGYIGKRKNDDLGTGVPCEHPGCLSHVSHPCEGCGRILGVPAPMTWRGYIAKLEAENETLKADKRLLMHVVHGRAMASSLPKHLKEE